MDNIEDKNQLLFRLLCADALRNKGIGFPETDCDINAFCKEYVPSDEEKKLFEEIKDDIIESHAVKRVLEKKNSFGFDAEKMEFGSASE